MAALRVGLLGLAFLCACGSAEPRGPEAAFDRLKVAVGAHDARLLYHALDTESRWASDTVWGYYREIPQIVAGFPPEARARELARVEVATRAPTAEDFFVAISANWGDPFAPLGGSGEGLGSRARVEREGSGAARVVTSTGLSVPVAAGSDGAWGYAGFRPELSRWRDAAANDVARLREDAKLYAK